MSSRWTIDPVKQQDCENNLIWTIKGTNQFVQSLDDFTSNERSSSDEHEQPTIEFTNAHDAVISIGNQSFSLSLLPVDFLEIYSQHGKQNDPNDHHLSLLGKASGRFIISETTNNGSISNNDIHDKKRARTELSSSKNTKPSVVVLDPLTFFGDHTMNAENEDEIEIQQQKPEKSTPNKRHSSTSETANDNHDTNFCSPQLWIRLDNVPFNEWNHVETSNNFSFVTESRYMQISLISILKRIFQDLKILAVIPCMQSLSVDSTIHLGNEITVYVRLSSAAAVKLSLQQPLISLASITQNINSGNNSYYITNDTNIRLSSVGLFECYIVERCLPSLSTKPEQGDEHTSKPSISQDNISDSSWRALFSVFSFDFITRRLKFQKDDFLLLTQWSQPHQLSKLLCELFSNKLNMDNLSKPIENLTHLPALSEQSLVYQLHGMRKHTFVSSHQSKLIYSSTYLRSTEKAKRINAKTQRGEESYQSINELMLQQCEKLAHDCCFVTSMVETILANIHGQEQILESVRQQMTAFLLRWMDLWQHVHVKLQNRILRLRQIREFLPHYVEQYEL